MVRKMEMWRVLGMGRVKTKTRRVKTSDKTLIHEMEIEGFALRERVYIL